MRRSRDATLLQHQIGNARVVAGVYCDAKAMAYARRHTGAETSRQPPSPTLHCTDVRQREAEEPHASRRGITRRACLSPSHDESVWWPFDLFRDSTGPLFTGTAAAPTPEQDVPLAIPPWLVLPGGKRCDQRSGTSSHTWMTVRASCRAAAIARALKVPHVASASSDRCAEIGGRDSRGSPRNRPDACDTPVTLSVFTAETRSGVRDDVRTRQPERYRSVAQCSAVTWGRRLSVPATTAPRRTPQTR